MGDQLYEILDQGKQWSNEVALALNNGGGAIFSHTFFSKCGKQMGAVIHAILDSGADQIILLGTVHPFPQHLPTRVKRVQWRRYFQRVLMGDLKSRISAGKSTPQR